MSVPEPFRPQPYLAYLMVTAATLMWAASTVIGRGVHEELPPFGLSFWRWFSAALVILPFAWSQIGSKLHTIRDNIKNGTNKLVSFEDFESRANNLEKELNLKYAN